MSAVAQVDERVHDLVRESLRPPELAEEQRVVRLRQEGVLLQQVAPPALQQVRLFVVSRQRTRHLHAQQQLPHLRCSPGGGQAPLREPATRLEAERAEMRGEVCEGDVEMVHVHAGERGPLQRAVEGLEDEVYRVGLVRDDVGVPALAQREALLLPRRLQARSHRVQQRLSRLRGQELLGLRLVEGVCGQPEALLQRLRPQRRGPDADLAEAELSGEVQHEEALRAGLQQVEEVGPGAQADARGKRVLHYISQPLHLFA